MQTQKATPILLRLPEVKRRTGMSRSLIYRMIQEGTFPRNIPICGSRTVAWSSESINHWVNEQIAQANNGEDK